MDRVERVAALARQAAKILPGPPRADDLAGAHAWTELVQATARRLAELAGTVAEQAVRGPVPRRVLTAEDLLELAAVSVPGGATASGTV